MKKKLIALLMAVIMLIGLAACGSKEEAYDFFEYSPPEHETHQMPEEINTVEDMHIAIKSIMERAFADGATYKDIPMCTMSSFYLSDQLENDGYDPHDFVGMRSADKSHSISMSSGSYPSPIDNLDVQFYGMADYEVKQSSIDSFNSIMTLGASKELLGKEIEEAFNYLGFTPIVRAFVQEFEDGTYNWYENEDTFWHIRYTETNHEYLGYKISLSFIRIENRHCQSFQIINDGNFINSVLYSEDFKSDEYMAILAESAREYHYQQDMLGTWMCIESETNGEKTEINPFLGRWQIELDLNREGAASIEGLMDEDFTVKWKKLRVENPGENEEVVFELNRFVEDTYLDTIEMRYLTSTHRIVIFSEDNTTKYTFEKWA